MAVCYWNTWKKFVQEGTLDPERINNRIAESWYRCKKRDVNPYLRKGQHILPVEKLLAHRERHKDFLNIAERHVKKMEPVFQEAGMMALLIDPCGHVLSVSGNRKTIFEAQKINFVEGVCWTEERVGTNAIGTALETGEAVMVNGPEHFSVASHQWSCAAAPVYDSQRNLVGVMDLTCPYTESHPFMLAMVSSLAYTAEQEMVRLAKSRHERFIQKAVELSDQYGDRLLVITDEEGKAVAASRPLRKKMPDYFGRTIEEMTSQTDTIVNQSIPLPSSREKIGTCFFLSENKNLSGTLLPKERFVFRGVTGISKSFQETLRKARIASLSDTTCFITGETGTGKELVARAIHENSSRKNGPFIAVNCGAVPKELMESEFFGYADGAFTGAKRGGHKGKFEQAHGGTLFLDEVAELPPAMQTALLRVLQDRKVVPVGATKEVAVDVRIIAATHKDLPKLVKEGKFREDLFYRLYVFLVRLPALCERKEDLPALIQYIGRKKNQDFEIPPAVLKKMQDYHWPGNIRELMNVIENVRLLALAGEEEAERYVDEYVSGQTGLCGKEKQDAPLTPREAIERDMILEALKHTKGNAAAAAKMLDIPRSTFYRKLRKYGL